MFIRQGKILEKNALKINKTLQLRLGGEGVIWEEFRDKKGYEQIYIMSFLKIHKKERKLKHFPSKAKTPPQIQDWMFME